MNNDTKETTVLLVLGFTVGWGLAGLLWASCTSKIVDTHEQLSVEFLKVITEYEELQVKNGELIAKYEKEVEGFIEQNN